jgi:hypothetical protein
MHRRETALAVSVPSAPGEASQGRCLEQMEEPHRSDRTDRMREKSPNWMAFIDPKPLTRQSIGDLLARAFPECVMAVASTCEELLEIKRRRIESPTLVITYVRSAITNTCVQSALELLRVRLPETSTVVLADSDDVAEVKRALTHGVRLHPYIGRMGSRGGCAQAYQRRWHLCSGGCVAIDSRKTG